MAADSPNWEEIARTLGRETDPKRRKELEHDLAIALERAGFQNFSREMPSVQRKRKPTGEK